MRSGFSLVQISILLTVASLVMVTVLPRSNSPLEAGKQCTDRMAAVYQSLRQFQMANGRLPCPGDATKATGHADYGKEAANNNTTNNCTGGTPAANFADSTNKIAIGMVPVKTLGLSADYALDSYGRHITYAVDTNAAVCGWGASTLPGTITVTDSGTASTTVAALVSHGPDGHGAYIPLPGASGTATRLNVNSTDADERTNAHVDASFAATAALNQFIKKTPTSGFNDTVLYKNATWNLNAFPTSAPRISSISPPANGTYSSGNSLTFTITYNTAVAVTGTPRLALTAITGGLTGTTGYANYVSGTGTTTLTFTYVVQSGDTAPTGLTIAAAVQANGGTIKAGNACPLATFTAPNLTGVIIGSNTFFYIADYGNYDVRSVSSAGTINAFAGTGTVTGNTGDGAAATSARFGSPTDAAVDSAGNVYIVDNYYSRVRKVNTSGVISNFAGNGTAGFSGDTGAATAAQLNYPTGIAVDSSGNVYIADQYNMRIRKVNASDGKISTVAGNGTAGFSGDSGAATSARLNYPSDVVVDSTGIMYIADSSNNRIRKVTTGGTISTFAGTGTGGYTGDGGAATSAQIYNPQYLTVDSSNAIYYSEYYYNRVRKITSGGTISTYAGNGSSTFSGDGGPATSAGVYYPYGLAMDNSNNLYIVDANVRIRKVTSGGTISTVAGTGTQGFSGNGAAATSAKISDPRGVAVSR